MARHDRTDPPDGGSGLFVQTSDEDLVHWNRQRIVNALLRETDLPRAVAVEISQEIQEVISGTRMRQRRLRDLGYLLREF